MNKLTGKQFMVLRSIVDYIGEHHYSPSIWEICELNGIASASTAHGYLERLKTKGMIVWEPTKSRTIKIVLRG